MAAQIGEGWDLYNDTTEASSFGWILNGTISTTRARTGARSFAQEQASNGNPSYRTVGNLAELYMGAGININQFAGVMGFLLAADDNGAPQIALCLNPTGQLQLIRGGSYGAGGGTVLWTNTPTEPLDSWNFYELGVKINNSAGFATVKKNGQQLVSLTNIDTQASSNAYADRVGFAADGTAGTVFYLDDFYLADTSGAENNTFLGEGRMRYPAPDGDDGSPGWSRSTGSLNYALVDEQPSNGDTDYVFASSGTPVDWYTLADLPAAVTAVRFVQPMSYAKKTDSGTATYRNNLRSIGGGGAATDHNGPSKSPGTTYGWFGDPVQTDPDTAGAWTPGSVNSLKLGIERLT